MLVAVIGVMVFDLRRSFLCELCCGVPPGRVFEQFLVTVVVDTRIELQ